MTRNYCGGKEVGRFDASCHHFTISCCTVFLIPDCTAALLLLLFPLLLFWWQLDMLLTWIPCVTFSGCTSCTGACWFTKTLINVHLMFRTWELQSSSVLPQKSSKCWGPSTTVLQPLVLVLILQPEQKLSLQTYDLGNQLLKIPTCVCGACLCHFFPRFWALVCWFGSLTNWGFSKVLRNLN